MRPRSFWEALVTNISAVSRSSRVSTAANALVLVFASVSHTPRTLLGRCSVLTNIFIATTKTEKSQQIVTDLMPDYVHLSYAGHALLGKTIVAELERIIYDDDERNDVEEKSSRT
jgi:lysophospholipase L1-like esterase